MWWALVALEMHVPQFRPSCFLPCWQCWERMRWCCGLSGHERLSSLRRTFPLSFLACERFKCATPCWDPSLSHTIWRSFCILSWFSLSQCFSLSPLQLHLRCVHPLLLLSSSLEADCCPLSSCCVAQIPHPSLPENYVQALWLEARQPRVMEPTFFPTVTLGTSGVSLQCGNQGWRSSSDEELPPPPDDRIQKTQNVPLPLGIPSGRSLASVGSTAFCCCALMRHSMTGVTLGAPISNALQAGTPLSLLTCTITVRRVPNFWINTPRYPSSALKPDQRCPTDPFSWNSGPARVAQSCVVLAYWLFLMPRHAATTEDLTGNAEALSCSVSFLRGAPFEHPF